MRPLGETKRHSPFLFFSFQFQEVITARATPWYNSVHDTWVANRYNTVYCRP